MKILVVEDEVSLRMAIRYQLSQFDATKTASIHVARNAAIALELIAAEGSFDLAVIDLRLTFASGIDDDGGFQVIARFQSNAEAGKTHVIVLSARNDDAALLEARKYDCVRSYLFKPWAQDELNEAIRYCLTCSSGFLENVAVNRMSQGAN